MIDMSMFKKRSLNGPVAIEKKTDFSGCIPLEPDPELLRLLERERNRITEMRERFARENGIGVLETDVQVTPEPDNPLRLCVTIRRRSVDAIESHPS